MTLIYFILILGITVFIHEFGHFIFAKKFGVYVYEFSIGMGPKILKFNRKGDETNYCLRLFPIGGFVQMAGEEIEVDEKIPENRRLMSKQAYQRLIIMVAGVMMNFLLALALYIFIGLFNQVSVDNVYIGSSAIKELNVNDRITNIDNHFVNNYDKLALEITIAGEKGYTMTVKDISGNKKEVDIRPVPIGKSNLIFGKDYGFGLASTDEKNKINLNDLIIINSSLENIVDGDRIIKINDENVASYIELINTLKDAPEEFNITVLDENEIEKTYVITVRENNEDQILGYSYGFEISGKEAKGFFGTLQYAFLKFFSTIEQMIFTVFYLITGRLSLNALSGPVGIFNVVGMYSKEGFTSLVSLLCLICINVGFINLLPLPAFDGGHVLFIIIEKIKGSKVNPKVENTIHNIGFILLMILMIIITYNDIIKLF